MSLDLSTAVADTYYRLGFTNSSDISTAPAWLTAAELYQFIDDAARKLASAHGLFIVFDNTVDVTAGTAAYSLPAGHVFTVIAWLVPASGPIQFLRLTSARDLWALDANWSTTSGDAVRASGDAAAVGTITLYPNPLTNSTLNLVAQIAPATVTSGAPTISLPAVLQDFFTYAALAGAKRKESDSLDLTMAGHYESRMDLYEQVMAHLWGPGR